MTGETRSGVATARQLQGKELSYNNINDTDAAYELVAEFDPGARGGRRHHQARQSLRRRRGREPRSRRLSQGAALRSGLGLRRHRRAQPQARRATRRARSSKIFTEVIIAPDADEEAIADHRGEEESAPAARPAACPIRAPTASPFAPSRAAFWCRSRDNAVVDDLDLKVVTKRAPTEQEIADMKFAFRVAKHVKSNAIVYAKDGATVGIGAGQMSPRRFRRASPPSRPSDAAQAAGLRRASPRGSVVGLGRVLPLRRWPAGGGGGRRDGGHPAGRLDQ